MSLSGRSILTLAFSVLLSFSLSAEESPEYYAELYHDTIDPAAVYVWDEASKTVGAAGSALAEKAGESAEWIYEHREAIGETIVLTVGYTAAEARGFWEAYGGVIGNTVVIVADEAAEIAKDAYAFSKETMGHLVLYYEKNHERIEEDIDMAMAAAAPYVKTAAVYVVSAYAGVLTEAVEYAREGRDYFREHQAEIFSGINDAYLWTDGKVVYLAEMAKETWIPSGLAMIGEAASYYDENMRPGLEEKGKLLADAARDAAEKAIDAGSLFVSQNKNKVIGVGIYLKETGGSIWNYVAAKAEGIASVEYAPDGILRNEMVSRAQGLTDSAGEIVRSAGNAVSGALEAAKPIGEAAVESAKETAKTVGEAVQSAGQAVMGALGSFFGGKK